MGRRDFVPVATPGKTKGHLNEIQGTMPPLQSPSKAVHDDAPIQARVYARDPSAIRSIYNELIRTS